MNTLDHILYNVTSTFMIEVIRKAWNYLPLVKKEAFQCCHLSILQ